MREKLSQIICIYNGPGAGVESIAQAEHMVHEIFPDKYKTILINDKDLILGEWSKSAVLLIMPGGADLFYVRKLHGKGVEVIKKFVHEGGAYLGLCAGGYFGCSSIEFDKNGNGSVVGKRELGFYPGMMVGPLLAPYDYKTNSGVRLADVQICIDEISSHLIPLYFNGGGYFANAENYSGVKVLADYLIEGKKLAAIVKMNAQKGKVILSGVHFEFSPKLLNQDDPFLKDVFPSLIRFDAERKNFVKKMMIELGLSILG